MRERAEAACDGWHPVEHWYAEHELRAMFKSTSTDLDADVAFVRSMNPGVVLALADWLEAFAADEVWRYYESLSSPPEPDSQMGAALAVARTYLGGVR